MAARQSNSKTGRKGKATGSKAKSARNNKKDIIHNKEKNPYYNEIILLVTSVFSIIIVLSYFKLTGIVGTYVNQGVFGTFGLLAYLFPFFFFIAVAFYVVNKGNKAAIGKLISAIGIFIILEGFLHILTGGTNQIQFLSYFTMAPEKNVGGGFIGACIGGFLYHFFGMAGAYVILIAGLILLAMFITEKLFFSSLGKKGSIAFETMREKRRNRQAYAEQHREIFDTVQEDEISKGRKKAATVTFTKEKVKEQKAVEKNKEVVKKMENEEFNSNRKSDFSYDLPTEEEWSTDSISIQRGEYIENGVEKAPLYKKILKEKFGVGKEKTVGENTEEVLQEAAEELVITNMADAGEDVNEVPADTRMQEHQKDDEYNNLVSEEKKDKTEEFVSRQEIMDDEEDIEEQKLKEMDFNHSVIAEDFYGETEDFQGTIGGSETEAFQQLEESITSENIPCTETKKEENPSILKKEQTIQQMEKKIEKMEEKRPYVFPPIDLLTLPDKSQKGMSDGELKEKAIKLQKTLDSFGVKVHITNVSCGPSVTRFELQPEQGVKVSKITRLADDIKLNLAAEEIRIEAPIPGKAAVGIEVPNRVNTMVMLRDLMESPKFQKHSSDVAFAVGKDIGGQTVVTDIAKMPHLLIAGATGSGKSVCINTLIMSILYKADPEDVKLIMIDPKVVELSVYNGIPHLLIPVVTDPKKASGALNWAVMEMTDRYNKFAELGVREIKGYNEKVAAVEEAEDPRFQKMPQIVIIVDELADLMMVAPGEVEESICRLAQLARAAGIHLIIATQRPSVNVITGLIKANIPSRIAFSVSSTIDSRTILDGGGAEKLLGKGDMLFFPAGYPKPVRVQGAFVSDKEVSAVVEFLTEENGGGNYSEEVADKIVSVQSVQQSALGANAKGNEFDDYFADAGKFIIEKDKASIGMLQRVYKIGFNRAARIMDQLSEAGVVGPEEGTKPRKVIMSLEEFEQYIEEYV